MKERLAALKLDEPKWDGCPVVFWDVYGEQGHPVRATISDMGPLLLARLLNLNDTQAGVLTLVFKIADDNGLLLLDLKDLRAMLQYVGDNAAQFKTDYGNVSTASIGTIQRGLLELEQQGGGEVLRRTDARDRRPHADRLERPWGRERARRREADAVAEALLHVSALAAVGVVRAPARGGRSRETEARVFLRRGASPLHRGAEGAAREGRAGGAAHPLERRRRLLLQPEPARHPRDRPRAARQPGPARAPRVHPEGPKGGEDGGADPAREPQARHREGDHGARRRRSARVAARRERARRGSSSARSSCRPHRRSARSRRRSGKR